MADDRIPAPPLRQVLPQMALTIGAFLLTMVLCKALFFPWLHRYLTVADPAEAARRARNFFYGFGAVLALFVLWPAWAGARILRSGQAPPPGTRVWRETPIRRGSLATQRALALFICALLLAGCAAAVLTIPARFARSGRSAADPLR